jgi:hypothetical protein
VGEVAAVTEGRDAGGRVFVVFLVLGIQRPGHKRDTTGQLTSRDTLSSPAMSRKTP